MVLALDYGRAAERAGEARGGVCLDAGGERVEEGGGRCYLAQWGGDEEEEVEEGLGGCEMHAGAFLRAWGVLGFSLTLWGSLLSYQRGQES